MSNSQLYESILTKLLVPSHLGEVEGPSGGLLRDCTCHCTGGCAGTIGRCPEITAGAGDWGGLVLSRAVPAHAVCPHTPPGHHLHLHLHLQHQVGHQLYHTHHTLVTVLTGCYPSLTTTSTRCQWKCCQYAYLKDRGGIWTVDGRFTCCMLCCVHQRL